MTASASLRSLTLVEAGIDKNLAKRSRKADAIPDDKFEEAAKAARIFGAHCDIAHHHATKSQVPCRA
jgi:hypothetical protein